MARGSATRGDVINQSAHGQDLNQIFRGGAGTVAALNSRQDNLRAMLGYRVFTSYGDVLQLAVVDDFEDAREFGVPKAIRAAASRSPLSVH